MSGALLGATLRACGGEEAAAVVAGLTGAGGVDLRSTRPLLLAHCHGGMVWGHAREDGWALSGAADSFPEASPPLAYEQIEELRLFTEVEELHLWRTEGGLRGRWLADAPDGTAQDWARPIDTQRVLLGDRRVSGPRGGFTLVRDAAAVTRCRWSVTRRTSRAGGRSCGCSCGSTWRRTPAPARYASERPA